MKVKIFTCFIQWWGDKRGLGSQGWDPGREVELGSPRVTGCSLLTVPCSEKNLREKQKDPELDPVRFKGYGTLEHETKKLHRQPRWAPSLLPPACCRGSFYLSTNFASTHRLCLWTHSSILPDNELGPKHSTLLSVMYPPLPWMKCGKQEELNKYKYM